LFRHAFQLLRNSDADQVFPQWQRHGRGAGRLPRGRARAGLVTRDPLPEVLRGNPERTEALIDASRHQWTYRAGVISFADSDAPTEDQQAEVMDGFERLAFAGLDPEQYEVRN